NANRVVNQGGKLPAHPASVATHLPITDDWQRPVTAARQSLALSQKVLAGHDAIHSGEKRLTTWNIAEGEIQIERAQLRRGGFAELEYALRLGREDERGV